MPCYDSRDNEHSAPDTSAEPRIRLRITPRSQEVYEALVKFQRIGELADIKLSPPDETKERQTVS